MEHVRTSCHDAMGLVKSELNELIGEEMRARNFPVRRVLSEFEITIVGSEAPTWFVWRLDLQPDWRWTRREQELL